MNRRFAGSDRPLRVCRQAPIFALALVLAACGSDSATGPPATVTPPRTLKPESDVGRVLFLGNSLTAVNRLPLMVDSLAAASGIRIRSSQITAGSYALVDHWDNPGTRAAVQSGGYRYVIMQQGPSSLPENRQLLRDWTALWAPVIREAGGRPGLYAVWPDASRRFAFGDVSESYRLAAEDVDGLFFPAGDTWLETWNMIPDAPLYGPDQFHPSVAGTYAAAVVIVSVLARREPTSLSSQWVVPASIGPPIDSTLAATIRRAASVVIARHAARDTSQAGAAFDDRGVGW